MRSDAIHDLATRIERELRNNASKERREFMAGYAPSGEPFIGAAVPVIRRAAKAARAELPTLHHRNSLARLLLTLGYAETRQAAYELLARDATALPGDEIETLG